MSLSTENSPLQTEMKALIDGGTARYLMTYETGVLYWFALNGQEVFNSTNLVGLGKDMEAGLLETIYVVEPVYQQNRDQFARQENKGIRVVQVPQDIFVPALLFETE